MKYLNGSEVFPDNLLEMIQDYVQGMYVYIPKKGDRKEDWGTGTNYKNELSKRDSHIYQKYLEGITTKQLESRYNLSSSSIRRIIFKEKGKFEGMNLKIKEILAHWNIQGDVNQIYTTAWDVSDKYIIKVYDNFGNMKRNITILKTLLKYDVPVAEVVPLTNGDDFWEEEQKYYILTKKLRGKNIENIHKRSTEVFCQMGEAISKLHLAFQKCENEISFRNNSLLDEMNGWIYEKLNTSDWKYINKEDYEETVKQLNSIYNELPKQLIHRDVYFGNFLFDKGRFSGYIDFDLSQKNIRIFDIAYFLLGILCEDDNHRVSKESWYDLVGEVIRGYEENIKLTECEEEHLTTVMKSIEILFTAYFMSINDEKYAENAASLYHFIKENEMKISKKINSL
jgi:Ser/Thr protein kinase RdoA (MazF antagonist)